jgi:hypothetical protein
MDGDPFEDTVESVANVKRGEKKGRLQGKNIY